VHGSRIPLLVLAGLALLLGVAVYGLDRPPGSAAFLPAAWSLAGSARPFGALAGQLPEFLHVFAFSLLTAAWLPATWRAAWSACASWWLIDSLFELGQHPKLAPLLAAATSGLQGIPLLEHTPGYFIHGVFDPLDLAAIALGALAAALCMQWVRISQQQKKKAGGESCIHVHSH